jgi:hypothetical protein
MSFVSQLLERLGVLTSDVPVKDHDDVSTQPPTSIPFAQSSVYDSASDLPNGELTEGIFDPEKTISSLDEAGLLDPEPFDGEQTLVGGAPEVTVVGLTQARTGVPQARSVTLANLLAERGLSTHPDVDSLGLDVDIALDEPFSTAFVQAGIHDAKHGWTIERVVKAVARRRSEGLTPVQVRFQVEASVVNDGGSVLDVAVDAAAKDEVLDALETSLAGRVEQRDGRLAERAENIHRQILALQAEREDLLGRALTERNRFAAWTDQKERTEKSWADALDVLAPFV